LKISLIKLSSSAISYIAFAYLLAALDCIN
jgi:hypothetical protein